MDSETNGRDRDIQAIIRSIVNDLQSEYSGGNSRIQSRHRLYWHKNILGYIIRERARTYRTVYINAKRELFHSGQSQLGSGNCDKVTDYQKHGNRFFWRVEHCWIDNEIEHYHSGIESHINRVHRYLGQESSTLLVRSLASLLADRAFVGGKVFLSCESYVKRYDMEIEKTR
jgi:hypothetical protein